MFTKINVMVKIFLSFFNSSWIFTRLYCLLVGLYYPGPYSMLALVIPKQYLELKPLREFFHSTPFSIYSDPFNTGPYYI